MKGQKRFIDREDDLREWISRLHSEVESMKQLLDKEDYSLTRSDINLSLNAQSGDFPEKEYIDIILEPQKDDSGKLIDYKISRGYSELKNLGIAINKSEEISVGIIAGKAQAGLISFLIDTVNSGKSRVTEFYNSIIEKYFQIVVNPIKDGRLELLLLDLTGFQKHKLQVKRYADLFYKAEESSTTGFFQYITSEKKILVSEGILSIFECLPQGSPAEFVTINQYLDTVHEEDKEMVLSAISEENLSSSIEFEHRIRIRKKIKFIRIRGSIFYDTVDDSISMIGTVEDVSDYKSLEKKMQFIKKQLDEIEKIAQIASWRYSFIDDEFSGSIGIANMLGITGEEFPLSFGALLNMLHSEDREKIYSEFQKSVADKHDLITDFKIIDKMGKVHYIHFLCWNYYQLDGKPDYSRGYCMDITDNKALRTELESVIENSGKIEKEYNLLKNNYKSDLKEELQKIRNQDKYRIQDYKWNSISDLLSKISLNWQEPLHLLSSHIQNIVESYQFGELNPEIMQSKHNDIKKIIEEMRKNLLLFKEHFDDQDLKNSFSLRQLLEEIILIMGNSLNDRGINIQFHAEEDLELVGSKTDISESVINVISNASKIFQKRDIDNPCIDIKLKKNGSCALLEICDNGGGIQEEHLDHIFDAYFSLEKKSKSSGLGLFIARKLVESKFSGKLEGFNEGAGACFRFTFPYPE